jgi:PAS domain S-box-containing protein
MQAVAKGGQDCLVKQQLTAARLTTAIRYAIERGRVLRQLRSEINKRQHSERTLRLIVEGTAAEIGTAFFQSLVRSLAKALSVRYALVSGCIDSPPTRVCTFAYWQDHEFGENIEYDLYGTPCEKVFSGQGCQYYSKDVQAIFPEDLGLEELQAQSYAGIPLVSSEGQLLGHLAVFDDKPLENEPRDTAILEIFAVRAAAEIERQQSGEALRISQEKFSKAFRSSPNSVTISTLNEGRYIEVNESCLQMFGYSPEEMIDHTAAELGIWARPADREAMKQQVQAQGTVANLEIEFRRKSGELFFGLLSAEVIELEDQSCLLTVITDITLIKQGSKALERLAEIGELASMIVHEIRNPLTTMLMGISAFKRLDLPERFQEYLALSLDEGERLERLLNQILLYAKPQTLHKVEIDLDNFIAEVINSLQNAPSAVGRLLECSSMPLRIQADKDKLKQVLINLITNACEAVEDHEKVIITVQACDTERVCIEVQNGGNPIPEEVLPQLMKPFLTTKASGNGLGLAIVKRIVEAHNGEIKITSSDTSGTIVKVVLPVG